MAHHFFLDFLCCRHTRYIQYTFSKHDHCLKLKRKVSKKHNSMCSTALSCNRLFRVPTRGWETLDIKPLSLHRKQNWWPPGVTTQLLDKTVSHCNQLTSHVQQHDRMSSTGSFSYSAVRRARRPRQRVQSLVDGTSYTGQSPAAAAGDPGSDLLTGRLKLWIGSSCKKQRQWLYTWWPIVKWPEWRSCYV